MNKILITTIVIGLASPSTLFPQHVGEYNGHTRYETNVDRNQNTRVPRLVQKKVISRLPIKRWVADPGEYLNESNPKKASKGHWEITGYRVTYRYVYDNGSSETETVEE